MHTCGRHLISSFSTPVRVLATTFTRPGGHGQPPAPLTDTQVLHALDAEIRVLGPRLLEILNCMHRIPSTVPLPVATVTTYRSSCLLDAHVLNAYKLRWLEPSEPRYAIGLHDDASV